MSNKTPYESDRIERHEPIKVKAERLCNICHRPIRVVPSDYDPRYVRFCMTCRYWAVPNRVFMSRGPWLNREVN